MRNPTRARHSHSRHSPAENGPQCNATPFHPNARVISRPIPTSRRRPLLDSAISSKDLFTRVERKTSKIRAKRQKLFGEERKVSDARRARRARDQNATAKKGSRAKETTFFYDDAQFLNTLADGISFVLSTNARLRNEDTHNTQKKSTHKERVFSFRSKKKKEFPKP